MLTALLLLLAAADPPVPPPVLAPYLHDGKFDPGDYRWARGRFDDASPAEKAEFATVAAWLGACTESGVKQTQFELAAMGVTDSKIEYPQMRDPVCTQVASIASAGSAHNFPEFQRAVAEARPLADTYLFALAMAEKSAQRYDDTLAARIQARPLGDQMLRNAASWGQGDAIAAPAVSPEARVILLSRIWAAVGVRDHANTEWLKAVVAKQGWPSIAMVGRGSSFTAWLLVQHADADPAFQLQVLRLMEPLAAKGEVSKRNYAFLYDRVMLKLAGKQRYATQFICKGGKHTAQPIEDPAAVDRLRSEVGLEPFAENLARMESSYGACPPDEPS